MFDCRRVDILELAGEFCFVVGKIETAAAISRSERDVGDFNDDLSRGRFGIPDIFAGSVDEVNVFVFAAFDRDFVAANSENVIVAADNRALYRARGKADNVVVAIVSDNVVAVAGRVNEDVIACAAGQAVIARAADDCIIAVATENRIFAVAAVNIIVLFGADNAVGK